MLITWYRLNYHIYDVIRSYLRLLQAFNPSYLHISTLYRRTTFMFICQTVNIGRFLEMLFCTRSFISLLRFGSLNMLLTLPVEKDCVGGRTKPCACGAKPVTLFYWMKAKVYPKFSYLLCLTKESVNTATLVHAPVCVCVHVCHTRRTEVWVIRVHLKYEVEPGPDWIPSFDGQISLWQTTKSCCGTVEVTFSLNLHPLDLVFGRLFDKLDAV